MRLISTFDNETQGLNFSAYLTIQGIQNECEMVTNTDWQSNEYGNWLWRVWVLEEDQVEISFKLLEDFLLNPDAPHIKNVSINNIKVTTSQRPRKSSYNDDENLIPNPPDLPPLHIHNYDNYLNEQNIPPVVEVKKPPFGKITLLLILICCGLFFWEEASMPSIPSKAPTYLPLSPLVTPKITKDLLYDYPQVYEITDQLVSTYGLDNLEKPNELPEEGQLLLLKLQNSSYWQGFYYKFLKYYRKPSEGTLKITEPIFEKIQQGEWWRTFSPCLLHNDIFHIFFNLFWLVILGNQMEAVLGKWKYLLFIVITGIFSNTAQYLMGGANFIGISGVLCAMLAFIYTRQQLAPWERYHLQKGTVTFMGFFILVMFGIQLSSFFSELYLNSSISPGIANTAHLSGIFIGWILGRFNFFAWKLR